MLDLAGAGSVILGVRRGCHLAMSKAENNEDAGIKSQRKEVIRYLMSQGVEHLGVGDYPAFHIHPCVAVWAVQSKKAPGWIGCEPITAHVPTHYLTRGKIPHPPAALP